MVVDLAAAVAVDDQSRRPVGGGVPVAPAQEADARGRTDEAEQVKIVDRIMAQAQKNANLLNSLVAPRAIRDGSLFAQANLNKAHFFAKRLVLPSNYRLCRVTTPERSALFGRDIGVEPRLETG